MNNRTDKYMQTMDREGGRGEPNTRWLFMECAVAGVCYHDDDHIVEELTVGTEIALVRQRDNKYDINAVAVALKGDYDGNPEEFDFRFILGYIPRNQNSELAAMLDMGWGDAFEAEISEICPYAPYSDRLHIAIYVRAQDALAAEKEADNRLRAVFFSYGKLLGMEQQLLEQGFAQYRWGGFPPSDHDLPKEGNNVAVICNTGNASVLYLLKVFTSHGKVTALLGDDKELRMVDDCTPYILTCIKGPVTVNSAMLDFLDDENISDWQPDRKLSKEASGKLMAIFMKK